VNDCSGSIRRALITGGGRRIGAELVKRCAALGFEVHCHVWRSQAAAQELLAQLPGKNHQLSCCDLSSPEDRQNWLKTLPGFDLVINNASCYRLTPAGGSEKASDRQRYWQVNYHAPLEIIAHQKNLLRHGRNALAITLLDCDVLEPDGGLKPYSEVPVGTDSYLATRIALAHKLLELSKEYAPALRLDAIAPGPVLPPVDCVGPGMTRILQKVPMQSSVGVEEIANAAEFFWRNPALTGVILPVDGGMHL